MFFHLGDLNTFDIDSSGRRFFFFSKFVEIKEVASLVKFLNQCQNLN